MAYTTLDEANITVQRAARPDDPDASLVYIPALGDKVLTLTASLTTEEHQVVGKVYEANDGELWYALNDEAIRAIGDNRPRQLSEDARRVLGFNL